MKKIVRNAILAALLINAIPLHPLSPTCRIAGNTVKTSLGFFWLISSIVTPFTMKKQIKMAEKNFDYFVEYQWEILQPLHLIEERRAAGGEGIHQHGTIEIAVATLARCLW